jgi:betaine-aldehyde dehydrogenase
MTILNGQWCEGPGKVFVHQRLAADFVDALVDQLGSVMIGDSRNERTTLGPRSHASHRDLVAS